MLPNQFSQVIAFLGFALLILFSIYQSYVKQDEIAYQNAKVAVTDFVDNVRMKGYISPKMVEDFEEKIEKGSYRFRTEYTHQKKVYTPIYTDPMNPATFTGDYVVDYDEYFKSQIFDNLFNESNSIRKDDRKYLMTTGDFFYVYIENMHKTKATMLFEYLTNSKGRDDVTIALPYGGMILNEDF